MRCSQAGFTPPNACNRRLILGDDEAPKLLYDRLKLEEARGRRLRSEIDSETMRHKAEAPALETYERFMETLANKANDKPHRPELRRALVALVEDIVLDPHSDAGVWCYSVQLKGARESVQIVCNPTSQLPFYHRLQRNAHLDASFIAS